MKIINKHTMLSFVIMSLSISSFAQGTCLWNGDRLREVKENPVKYQQLISQSRRNADSHLHQPLITVTEKSNRFVKNTHNYASLSIYFWPDERNPHGKYILKDGQINPEYKKYDLDKLDRLRHKMRHLSIAYYLTEDIKYRNAYLNQLEAWFLNRNTYMYPNFDMAQVAPGYDNNKGRAAGLIEAYMFNEIIESIRLVNDVEPIAKKTMRNLRSWFEDFSEWLETSDKGISEFNSDTNHGIAYDVLLLNCKLFSTGYLDEDLCNSFRERRLMKQFDNDGKQPAELKRTRAFYYTVYNLTHIIDFCRLVESTGRSFYQENSDIIDAGFNWALQYIGNQNRFPYKEISSSWSSIENELKREYNRITKVNKKGDEYSFDFFSTIENIHY